MILPTACTGAPRMVAPAQPRPYLLIFAALIILLHLAVYSATKLRNSGGELANGMPPMAAILAANLESDKARLTCSLSFVMISAGVFAGAASPCHPSPWYPGTTSAIAGTVGSSPSRVGDVTPS